MNQELIKRIHDDEHNYETTLINTAKRITDDERIKLVLITGGSCAGKTTTTRKLSELINASGRRTYTVSLDDYYRNLDESVYLPDGTRDIESINSLRVDLIRQTLKDLLEGREAAIPYFDFITKRRKDGHRHIKLEKGDIVIIEGLHALNLELFENVPESHEIFRIYLYADAKDGSDCRFIRRMVRDSRHRAASAEHTYTLWDNVKANEVVAIEPFRKYADVEINTFFPYERGILNDDGVALLSTVGADSAHYENAQSLIKVLLPFEQISDEYIPENSLLREFI